jgi:aldehyde dehydrogenase (NAD+)
LRKAAEYLQADREAVIDVIVSETGGTLLKANVEFQLVIEILEEALRYAGEIQKVREVPSNIEGKVNYIYCLYFSI